MAIRVKLYGTMRRFSQPGTPGLWQGDVPPGTTIEALLHQLGTTSAEVSGMMVNGEMAALDTVIHDDAEIILVTRMGGG